MPEEITLQEIKQKALELGWDDVGIAPARIPDEDIASYCSWVANKKHADLAYMENALRCYPEKLFPGAQSAIIFVTAYKQPKSTFRNDAGLVASYARGRDYHHVHRKRLKRFVLWLEERANQKEIAKGFSDSTPILEKALAVQAGLGWMGKNTLLIHRKFGTFILLSGVLTTLRLPFSTPVMRLPKCGSCQRCLDACPTQALSPYQLDATKCLSYHLIESKKEIPEEIRGKNPGYIFGCDICQDVCPHNVRTKVALRPEFSSSSGIGDYIGKEELIQLQQQPEKLHGTPLQRRGVDGLQHTASTLNLTDLN